MGACSSSAATSPPRTVQQPQHTPGFTQQAAPRPNTPPHPQHRQLVPEQQQQPYAGPYVLPQPQPSAPDLAPEQWQAQPPPPPYSQSVPEPQITGSLVHSPVPTPSVPLQYAAYLRPFQYSRTVAAQQGGEVEKEPMLLLDVTGSMNLPTKEGGRVPRYETVREALGRIVRVLAEADSQAQDEQGEGEEGGGLRTVLFAAGHAMDIGDLNPRNLRAKFERIEWGGGTEIIPGWNVLLSTYRSEFGARPAHARPVLLALIVTDGEALDTDELAAVLWDPQPDIFVLIAVIGYGSEHEHAVQLYNQIAARNDHVRVIPFDSVTDPDVISRSLLTMIT